MRHQRLAAWAEERWQVRALPGAPPAAAPVNGYEDPTAEPDDESVVEPQDG